MNEGCGFDYGATANNQLTINPKDKNSFSGIPTLIHHHLPRFNALPVLPLGKLLKRLGTQVEVNQRGLCILQQ